MLLSSSAPWWHSWLLYCTVCKGRRRPAGVFYPFDSMWGRLSTKCALNTVFIPSFILSCHILTVQYSTRIVHTLVGHASSSFYSYHPEKMTCGTHLSAHNFQPTTSTALSFSTAFHSMAASYTSTFLLSFLPSSPHLSTTPHAVIIIQ